MNILQECQKLAPRAQSIALKDGGEMILINESSVEEYLSLANAAQAWGFAYKTSREEGGLLFSTYEKDGHVSDVL